MVSSVQFHSKILPINQFLLTSNEFFFKENPRENHQEQMTDLELEALIRDMDNKLEISRSKNLERRTKIEEYQRRNDMKRALIKQLKLNLITPEQEKALEELKLRRAQLGESVRKISDASQSFPFKEAEAYRTMKEKSQRDKMELVQKQLNDQLDEFTDNYKNLHIVKKLVAKKELKAAAQSKLDEADEKLRELDVRQNQITDDFNQKMMEKVIRLATIVPQLNAVQNSIKEKQLATQKLNDSMKRKDIEMEQLNRERLELERKIYTEKNKAKPARIEKIKFEFLKTNVTGRKVDFNKKVQAISPSSSDSSVWSKKLFVPFVEQPIKRKHVKHVPQLIPINSLKSSIKVPRPTETIDKQLKNFEQEQLFTPKKQESVVIKPKQLCLPSTSTALPNNPKIEFVQPTANIRIVSKRRECSPISLKDLQKLSPVPIKKIKFMPIPQRSEEIEPYVSSNEEALDTDLDSIKSLDLMENLDVDMAELKNFDMDSDLSAQISDVDSKTSHTDDVDKNQSTTNFFGKPDSPEKIDFFLF